MGYRKYRRRSQSKRFRRNFKKRTGGKFKNRVIRVIRRMAETKQVNGILNFNSVSTTEYTEVFPPITQGVGDNQRIGNVVQCKNIMIDLTFKWQTGTTNTGTTPVNMRVYLVYPRNTSRSDTTALITATNFPLYIRHDEDSWIVWKVWNFTLTNGASDRGDNSGTTVVKRLKYFKRWSQRLNFANAGQSVSFRQPYLIYACDANTVDTRFHIDGYHRLAYVDV